MLEWPRTGERLNRETFQKYRRIGGPVVIHTNTEEMVGRRDRESADDDCERRVLGERRGPSADEQDLLEGVRPLRPRGASVTLMDAIRKMTLMPAERLQTRVPAMRNKGRLRVGADADITVFDAARVIDRSTYREPGVPPLGIRM